MPSEIKTCLITGAARGIGAATARELAGLGWQVIVNYRSSETEAEQVVAGIHESGGKAEAIRGDVADRADMERLAATLQERGSVLDCLIHNAAAPFQRGPTSRVAWSPAFTSQIDTSCQGFLNCVQRLQPVMSQDCTVLALLTSALTIFDGAETAAYLAGKGALLGLCQGWQRELSAKGRSLILVSPGATKTDLLLRSGGTHPRQIELLGQALDQAGAATPGEVAQQIGRIVTRAATLSTNSPTPLHLVVDKHAIRRLEWTLHDLDL